MNDTTNNQQQQHQHQHLQQALPTPTTTNNANQQNSARATQSQHSHASAEAQVEIVSSTSCDTVAAAATAVQLTAAALITSPARISSSTGNDSSNCASSPLQLSSLGSDAEQRRAITAAVGCGEDVAQVPARQQPTTATSSRAAAQLEVTSRTAASNTPSSLSGADAMPTTVDRSALSVSVSVTESVAVETGAQAISNCTTAAAAATTTSSNKLRNTSINNNNIRSIKPVYRNISNNNNDDDNTNQQNMVTRETAPATVAGDLAGVDAAAATTGSGENVGVSTNENHKIILKLSKPTAAAAAAEPHQQQSGGSSSCYSSCSSSNAHAHVESHVDTDATTSGCSNSSSGVAEDTRKVEPLKINLHAHSTHSSHAHAHSHSHSHSSHTHHSQSGGSSGVVPKITIKPIVKQPQNDASDCSSSSVEDELPSLSSTLTRGQNSPIPKLTIKAATVAAAAAAADGNGGIVAGTVEPHIVPKLTIRSASEEGGGPAHTTIVPKLTIKMSDAPGGSALNSLHAPTAAPATVRERDASTHSHAKPSAQCLPASASATSAQLTAAQVLTPQPPLPKLTIKTSLDGTSESIISTISPASSCYSSSSSSSSSSNSCYSVSALATATLATAASSISSASVAAVPKLTIKTMQPKCSSEETAVPKLTIKTHATGGAACTLSSNCDQLDVATEDTGGGGATSSGSKIPKLTIKTGQEHAVIITQHSDAKHAQTIPKLTIKTKSLDVEDASDEGPQEKIPKITIKTSGETLAAETPKFCIKTPQQQHESNAAPAAIPKLTISVSNLEGNSAPQSPKQSPLVVRQLAACSSRKPASPERVPKLMISRQDSLTVVNNHGDALVGEKLVPKLTIKTHSLESGESKDKPPKFAIKTSGTQPEEDKIPKLTIIKPTPPASSHLQSSEDSDECLSVASSTPSPPEHSAAATSAQQHKVVPKLTIKNLCSPKLKMKAVLDDKSACSGRSTTTSTTTSNTTTTTTETASKKCSKSSDEKNVNEPNVSLDARAPNIKNNSSIEQPSGSSNNNNAHSLAGISDAVANGGESSNSQEFCGFNDNTTDSAVEAALAIGGDVHELLEEPRRYSDDMDIDEALQQHDPEIFNNVTHFAINNGLNFVTDHHSGGGNAADNQLSHVIDTVDLTSSPSPGSSPAHFNYTDADPQLPAEQLLQQQVSPARLLMECLQRESSVIQTAPPSAANATILENTSFLLSQLTAPRNATKHVASGLPPLQPKPQQAVPTTLHRNNSIKYPQLTERLLANGALGTLGSCSSAPSSLSGGSTLAPAGGVVASPKAAAETVIDSIEILDTPEGSPRSSFDEENEAAEQYAVAAAAAAAATNHVNDVNDIYLSQHDTVDIIKRNNNNMLQMHQSNHVNLKRHANHVSMETHTLEQRLEVTPNKMRRIENNAHTMATLTILTNDDLLPTATVISTSPTIVTPNRCLEQSNDVTAEAQLLEASSPPKQSTAPTAAHRSRKQRHEHLLTMPVDEEDPLQLNSIDGANSAASNCYEGNKEAAVTPVPAPVVATAKKRGRPKKLHNNSDAAQLQPQQQLELPASTEKPAVKSRLSRVQLLRKRLAIDMVASEQPPLNEMETAEFGGDAVAELSSSSRQERALRTPLRNARRSATPSVPSEAKPRRNGSSDLAGGNKRGKRGVAAAESLSAGSDSTACHNNSGSLLSAGFNHFGGSNSSLSSACSSSSMSSTTVTTTAAASAAGIAAGGGSAGQLALASQIDLTMSSSSSSASNGSTTATVTTSQSRCNSMLPPTTILSSSDPVPDVVFKPNDFSCIMAAAAVSASSRQLFGRSDSQDEEADNITGGSGADNSGDDSAASSGSQPTTPGRGRGRGRGSRGGRGGVSGRGPRAHRLGRGASAVAKAIASTRPRCVGGLKHTPDPQRLKGLFSPSPQVFEEDTRMSADLSQIQILEPPAPLTPIKQPDFLANEESQSSVVSNNSILDPNALPSVQNGSAIKRPKKKKMEVCVAEDTDFTVASIAEYDWPPPKGCCPSKNRDTFMIQEQVAHYLGIKSFKRKYPDLPRRQVDMEERNWLQEKALVSEKMCDLGITAVWASDILDIMYTDFYDKYEEYKDFIRQKHIREIEAKTKALGLNVNGRGLQARDRAMLSANKWNAYFNKSRKEERFCCLDLQTNIINVPLPASAASTTLVNRPIADAVACAAKAENIPEPPTLLKPRLCEPTLRPATSYPLALVNGQFAEKYRHYTPLELRSYPLSTVLDDPRTLLARLCQQQEQEQSLSETDIETDAQQAATDAVATTAATGVTVTNAATGVAVPNAASATGLAAKDAQRVPVRRSRRARTIATKLKCDTVSSSAAERVAKNSSLLLPPPSPLAGCSSSTEGSSSSSDDSASETDSETDSCSSYSSASSTESEDESAPTLCGVCQRTQHNNLKELPEVFIKCYTCRRKVHPSCIEMPHRMVARVRNYNWQCADCKCCIKCKRKQDANKMLYCEQCDRGYHIYCLDVKAVPDGRWSCERCSVCMRCGATKPEGLPPAQQQNAVSPSGEKVKQVKHKKVKWINEYRIDHITKLREHCSMLCVPCGRMKTTKRVQIANANSSNHSNNNSNNASSNNSTTHTTGSGGGGHNAVVAATTAQQQQQHHTTTAATTQQQQHHQQQQHVKQLQHAQLATATMSPPAAPLSTSATNSGGSNNSSVAAATLPPPAVVA